MSEPSSLTEQDRANLVAYLDGELEEGEARALETRLSLDPKARAEADALRRTWELLDFLPQPAPSRSFTNRTIERLVPIQATATVRARRWRRWTGGLGWAAALLLAAWGGFAGYLHFAQPRPGDRELQRDLRLIENMPLYGNVPDFAFVEHLDSPDLFGESDRERKEHLDNPDLAAGAPVVPESRPAAADLEHNRQLLEKWRKDSEHYQRLRDNLAAFWALPPAEQQRLRQIDQAVHAAPSRERVDRLFRDLDRNKDGKISKDEAPGEVRRQFDEIDRDENGSIDRDELLGAATKIRQKRLLRVLVRYNAWLGRLCQTAPETCARIQTVPSSERLVIIREVRRQQWIEALPDHLREQLLKLPPEKQEKEIARLRKEESEHRREWMRADWIHWPRRPRKLTDLSAGVQREVKQYTTNLLVPHLSKEERELLRRDAVFTQLSTILDLAQRHADLLPPHPGHDPITNYEGLPGEVKKLLADIPEGKKRLLHPGRPLKRGKERRKWPDYALNVVRVIELHHPKSHPIPPLGASRPTEFPPLARDFIEHQLPKTLTDKEKKELKQAEGKWPKYPHLVRDLARKHQLLLPPLALPGPIELWHPPGPGERGPGMKPRSPRDTTRVH